MRASLVLAALSLAACSAPSGDKQLSEVDIDKLAIFHGSAVDQPKHDATASIHYVYYGQWVGEAFCSGTLIFDRWILTAGHCVEGLGANDMVVHFGEDSASIDPANLHLVADVIAHNQYNSWTLANDIALIELQSTPTYADPVMPLPNDIGLSSADEGDLIDLAGFGYQENGDYGELMHIEVEIDDVRSTEVEYDQGNGFGNGTGGACNGDSGGPAFFDRDGHTYVAGVTSYGDQNCTDYGVSTRVDAYEAFIENNTGEDVTDLSSGGGTTTSSPSGTTFTETGTLNTGDVEGWSYTTLAAGEHEITLTGDAGTDFDLYWLVWNGSRWKVKQASTGVTSDEYLSIDVPRSGEFMAAVKSYSGSGDYELTVTHP